MKNLERAVEHDDCYHAIARSTATSSPESG